MADLELWHYTCGCGRKGIGEKGHLIPLTTRRPGMARELQRPDLAWLFKLVWLTDLETPDRDGLGLTMNTISCDRTVHRYRATDVSTCRRWIVYARRLSTESRRELEFNAPGTLPAHWWVSEQPVPVEYAPRVVRDGR